MNFLNFFRLKPDVNDTTSGTMKQTDTPDTSSTNKEEDEDQLISELLKTNVPVSEIYERIRDFIKKYYLKDSKIKFLTRKQQYDIVKEIIEKQPERVDKGYILYLDRVFKLLFLQTITESKNPSEVKTAYNKYVNDFLSGDNVKEQEFRRNIRGIEDDEDIGSPDRNLLIRKIDCLNDLKDITFDSMDKVPLFYDTEKEEPSSKTNARIARNKIDNRITAEDLVFVRLEKNFPLDGIVENVGNYFEPEYMNSIFYDELKDFNINREKYQIAIPRCRWTTHWCINGAVGDHTQGNFSGRDYVIIEDASEKKGDQSIAGDNVADTIFIGDTKLSKNSRVVMSKNKYLELIKNKKMKSQLEKMNIVIFNGNHQEQCVRLLLNDMGYVYGFISSYSYSRGIEYYNQSMRTETLDDEQIEDLYLANIERALKAGDVEGLEHCHYAPEGFAIKDIDPKKCSLINKMSDINRISKKIVKGKESTESYPDLSEVSLKSSSLLVDEFYARSSKIKYIELLCGKFPNNDALKRLYIAIKGYLFENSSNWEERYKKAKQDFIETVDLEELLKATKEYNATVIQESVEARKRKDLELLNKGLISKSEYDERQQSTVEAEHSISAGS